MARVSCRYCGHNWVRLCKPSRGQPIRCPKCGKTIGHMSTPFKPLVPMKANKGKAINEYGKKEKT